MSLADSRIIGASLLLLLCVPVARADGISTDDRDDPPSQEQPERHSYALLESGYRFVSSDGVTALANPYGVNRSGATAYFAAGFLEADLKLRADGQFLHPDDYQSELFFDYGGIIRAELEGRSLYHNLLRHPLFSDFQSVANAPLGLPAVDYRAVSLPDSHELGITSRQDRADTRIRLGNLPAHLSLGYWRFSQSGYDQLVVADYERTHAVNTFYDVTRRIDQVTQEGRFGLDANLGPVSLAYNFKIREFGSSAPNSYAPFAAAVPSASRVISHTVTLYSNLSGGLTAAAAYTLTRRENTSQRTDLIYSGQPADTIQHIAGDLSYTPFKELTLAFKYRHRQLDRQTPESVTSLYSGTSLVRPGTSSVEDTLSLLSSWRPDSVLTLQGEYRARLISRENVFVPMTAASAVPAVTSDANQLQSGILTALWRPWRTTRLNASYSYTTNSRPTTLHDFNDRHNGNLLIDWSHNARFGAMLHYRATAEQNSATSSTTTTPLTALATPRNSLSQSAGVALWFSPLPRLVVTTSYGCMAIDARQALLFSPQTAASLATSNYSSLAHVYGLDGSYAINDRVDLSVSLQQVRSRADFQVPAQSFTLASAYSATTAGIGSFGHLDTIESSVASRIDWRLYKQFGWMLEYRFSAYRSDETQYNGDIHSATVSLTARW